jgi:hypothetical protein
MNIYICMSEYKKTMDALINETVDEVLFKLEKRSLREYGPEWNAKLESALKNLEELALHDGRPFADRLKSIQQINGLNDYETFQVGENSSFPTSNQFWQQMGPNYVKFIGGYSDNGQVAEEIPQPPEQLFAGTVNI